MNSAAQLAAGVAIGEGAASFLFGQRNRVRFQEEFTDRALGRDALAVVPAQQLDHGVAIFEDSRVFFGRNLDVVVCAAGLDAGAAVDSRASAGIAAKVRLKDGSGVDYYPVDLGQQSALLERAQVPAPGSFVEIAQPSLGERS